MNTRNDHWNAVFSAKSDAELGWYEDDVSQTLKFLDQIPGHEPITIFVPGAGTSLLVDKLLAQGHRLILNDISDAALDKLRQRLAADNDTIWLHHDISKPLPDTLPQVDVWIDRAVLHFLVEESDIEAYFANLNAAMVPGGYVLLAEFSTQGVAKCAGLNVHRYSVEEMTRRMGKQFQLISHEYYTYTNPGGEPRPYVYALYRRHDGP